MLPCLNCSLSLDSPLYCFSCSTIQTFPKNLNFFKVFNFSTRFDIDPLELEDKYQKLSLELHPDFYESAPEEEKKMSERASSFLNTAYKTLVDKSLRAQYLLSLFSQNKKLDERSLPDGFLVEMFMLQESLDEFLESENKTELLTLKSKLMRRHNKIEEDFYIIFKKLKDFPNNDQILQQLQTNLNADRYLLRLLDRIN